MLDGIGYLDAYMTEHTEAVLEYSEWMGIPINPDPVTLDRFKSLLAYQAEKLHGNGGARVAVAVLRMESTTVIVK